MYIYQNIDRNIENNARRSSMFYASMLSKFAPRFTQSSITF